MEEIQRSPVEVGSLPHYLQGFSTIPGGFLAGFLVAINRITFREVMESLIRMKEEGL